MSDVIILGAGPAGLTAGYLLTKKGYSVTLLEADPTTVGGISRTVKSQGFHFDIGGHRFFSKSQEVESFWTEILGDELLVRPRSSRIFYRKKFFSYPLKAIEALLNLGIFESILCILSYGWRQLFPIRPVKSFEDWVTNQFGSRLFRIFFKTYTEKVWGMSCKDISADWAAQRIKGLSLASAAFNAVFGSFLKKRDRGNVIKTLIDSFRYPRKGPGMMWERCADLIRERGGVLHMGTLVTHCQYEAATKKWVVSTKDAAGKKQTFEGQRVISSMAMRELVQGLSPAPAPAVIQAAKSLGYRDFVTVALMTKGPELFPDNWIYIHDPSVLVGRIQNFKSWSPEMVPSPEFGCYGLEYFCFEGDGLWNSSDAELIALAKKELNSIGLGKTQEIVGGSVVRQPKAYPVYDDHYQKHVDTIRQAIDRSYPELYLVGRNGMHKYNNQDHAMMTAMLTVENIVAGRPVYDVWNVNQDAEYIEESSEQDGSSRVSTSGLRAVPQKIPSEEAADSLSS